MGQARTLGQVGMPRVKERTTRPKGPKLMVKTEKLVDTLIRCLKCGYHGLEDVVHIYKRRAPERMIHRCPQCKSLNIVSETETIMAEDKKWKVDEWTGCYPSQWKGVVVNEAMAHPAKFSSRLIRRIYEHLFDMEWVDSGDRILDPFGGVGLGALNAMEMGLGWTGVELEPKFVNLGAQNLKRWKIKYRALPRWSGQAVLLQGDSRTLLEVVGKGRMVDATVSSPPYKNETDGDGLNVDKPETFRGVLRDGSLSMGESDGNLGRMDDGNFSGAISSPPYTGSVQPEKNSTGINLERQFETYKNSGGGQSFDAFVKTQEFHSQGYGESDGQLGAMPTSPTSFEAAISSPPFRQSEGGTPEPKPGGVIDERLYARHAAGNSAAEGYGSTDGNLANMQEGDFNGIVSSPPFEDKLSADRVDAETRRNLARSMGISNAEHISPIDMEAIGGREQKDARYGFTDGQLGADSGDDFWLAARRIVEQVFLALEAGGHAVWVCKDFVRGGERVPFSDQWRQLCEAVGFVTVHEHHALLVNHKGSSMTLEGETVKHMTESKSFFRRLAEKKGSPRIDWEVVYCMEKPA